MFSNTPAPKLMLIIPVMLTAIVVLLLVLTLRSFTPGSSATNNTNTVSAGNNPDFQSSSSVSQQSEDEKAMFAVPAGNYPANKCPTTLVIEPSNNFALENGMKYSLSNENKTWIQSNCPNVKTLTF